MADPTYNWNEITEAQTDADSPIDTALMEGIRRNLVHLKEWLGESFTPARDHDHDGINSKSVLLADSVVTVAKLNLMRGSFSAASGGDFYVTISRYSHVPSLTKLGSVYNVQLFLQTDIHSTVSDINEVLVRAPYGNGETFFVFWDYHAS
ncbi:MAG: hypothetical protein H3C68_08125 [Deltaproteobacteria bacterium]|nr:hypothetical protein [Deltaproteobacteria bacterium]MBZ0219334.1 hypothetical protein [Deltaproteobacteria bacterium]